MPELLPHPLAPQTLADTLNRLGIAALNPMQIAMGEACGKHPKILLLAATGSGKTLAFLLPLWETLDVNAGQNPQAMIVTPSRELAQQIGEVFTKMGTGLKSTLCYGGHKREVEENNLREAPALVIGTPGRLCDHIRRENFPTDGIRTLILDEFDKTLEEGFLEEVRFLTEQLPALERIYLTSATRAVDIPEFLPMEEAVTIDFLEATQRPDRLDIYSVNSPEADKLHILAMLLGEIGDKASIVFCNHRDAVERVQQYLKDQGFAAVFYHGGMEQHERDIALCKFRNGSALTLVTTDLAARGLDIDRVRHIVHYHLPGTREDFVHRNGRTARIERHGTVFVLLGPEEVTPDYMEALPCPFALPEPVKTPEKPEWSTLFVAAGKKDKVNKVDLVGFLTQKAELRKEDIGLIEVRDYSAFVAIRRSRMSHVLTRIRDHKIKGKRVKMAIAK